MLILKQKSCVTREVRESMESILSDFYTLAPRLEKYRELFNNLEGQSEIHVAIISIYHAVLDFIFEANEWIKSQSAGMSISTTVDYDERGGEC